MGRDLEWEQKGKEWPRVGDLMRDLPRSPLGPLSDSTLGNSPRELLRVNRAEEERIFKNLWVQTVPVRSGSLLEAVIDITDIFQETQTQILHNYYQKAVKEETQPNLLTSQVQPRYGHHGKELQINLSFQRRCKNIKQTRELAVSNRRKAVSLPSV